MEGSRARGSPSVEKWRGLKMKSLIFGGSATESFANYDPGSSCWRTHQLSLFGGRSTYSGVLPRSGTMRSGQLSRLHQSVRPTAGRGFSSFAIPPQAQTRDGLLPTPTTGTQRTQYQQGGRPLLYMVLRMENNFGEEMRLHPLFVEWMMGFPTGWNAAGHTATPSCRSALSGLEEG